jgi:hypothetical protein
MVAALKASVAAIAARQAKGDLKKRGLIGMTTS